METQSIGNAIGVPTPDENNPGNNSQQNLFAFPSGNNDNSQNGHDTSGHCQKIIHVPAHSREGKPVNAYDRICGRDHDEKEAQQKNNPYTQWNTPLNLKNGQYLSFNGKSLTLHENGEIIKEWKGVSGRPGFQHPNYQDLKNYGPLPEGNYVAKISDFQKWENLGAWQKFKSSIGGGQWRGGTAAWGEQRIWLTPANDTNLYGRNNFSIHGGLTPGSAGCIDLTKAMADFAKWFQNNGYDVIVQVKY